MKTIPQNLYFSKDSTDFGQTFKPWRWVFTQYILQILLKQLMWFNRHNSLNF